MKKPLHQHLSHTGNSSCSATNHNKLGTLGATGQLVALDRLSRGKLGVQATVPCNRAPENPWCYFQASQDHHVRSPAPVRYGSPMGPLTLVNTSPGLVCATALPLPPGLGVSRHFNVTHRVATRSQSYKEMPGGTHPAPQPV